MPDQAQAANPHLGPTSELSNLLQVGLVHGSAKSDTVGVGHSGAASSILGDASTQQKVAEYGMQEDVDDIVRRLSSSTVAQSSQVSQDHAAAAAAAANNAALVDGRPLSQWAARPAAALDQDANTLALAPAAPCDVPVFDASPSSTANMRQQPQPSHSQQSLLDFVPGHAEIDLEAAGVGVRLQQTSNV